MQKRLKKLEKESLFKKDVVYSLLYQYSAKKIGISSLIYFLLVYIASGFAALYFLSDKNILPITDSAEWITGVSVWVIFGPVIFYLYRWLPENTINLIQQIEKQDIIRSGEKQLSNLLIKAVSKKWIPIVGLLITIFSILYMLFIFIPEQNQQMGKISFWYCHPVLKSILLIQYTFINYVLWVLALRMIIIVWGISEFFTRKKVIKQLFPLHPDKCGGLGALGKLSKHFAYIAILVAVWGVILALHPFFAGGEANIRSIIIVNVAYVILMPFLIFLPIWQPHKAMCRYKDTKMELVSFEFLESSEISLQNLKNDSHELLLTNVEKMEQLETLHSMLEKEIPVWPIAFNAKGIFGVVASSPIVLGWLPIILDLINQYILT